MVQRTEEFNSLPPPYGLLKDQGEYGEARSLFEEVLEIEARELGPEHPSTLVTKHNLASVLKDQGEYGKARSLYEEVLEARARVLGPDHPETVESSRACSEIGGNEQ